MKLSKEFKCFMLAIVSVCFAVQPLFAQDLDKKCEKKYSSAEFWYGGNNLNGTIVTELSILDGGSDYKNVRIKKYIYPFDQKSEITVRAQSNGVHYGFSCADEYMNKVFGYFKYTRRGVILYMNVKEYSDEGRDCFRMYGEECFLFETSSDEDFFENACNVPEIKETLCSANEKYWPKDNPLLCVRYVGRVNGLTLYSSSLQKNKSSYAANRLAVFEDGVYLGQVEGIDYCYYLANSDLVFPEVDSEYGNSVDLSEEFPDSFVVDWEQFYFRRAE